MQPILHSTILYITKVLTDWLWDPPSLLFNW